MTQQELTTEEKKLPDFKNLIKNIGNVVLVVMIAIFILSVTVVNFYRFSALTPLQVIQTALDFFSMALCIVLFGACYYDRDKLEGEKKQFLFLTVVLFIALFSDLSTWFLGEISGARVLGFIMLQLVSFMYPLYGLFCFEYISDYLELREKPYFKKLHRVVFAGFGLEVFGRFINAFFPIYFYIDEAGYYRRTPLYPLAAVLSVALMFLCSFLIMQNRKQLQFHRFLILILFILAPGIGVIPDLFVKDFTPAFPTASALLLLIYSVLNLEKSRARAAVEQELSVAKNIQESMLPKLSFDTPVAKEYELYASMDAAREVGGDFFDFFMLDDHRLAFLVADVSDKGVGAALFMAVSKSMIKMRAQLGGSPAEVLGDVSDKIGKNNELGMFVTVWLGYLDLTNGHVVACNAGHDYPALYLSQKEQQSYVVEKTPHGPPVAFIPGLPFPEIEFTMNPGDRIFLYTDGVNEAQGSDEEEFGVDRMLEVLNEHSDLDSAALCKTMKETVNRFVGKDPQFDDMTMMALTFKDYRKKQADDLDFAQISETAAAQN